jgi:hypothetical protein
MAASPKSNQRVEFIEAARHGAFWGKAASTDAPLALNRYEIIARPMSPGSPRCCTAEARAHGPFSALRSASSVCGPRMPSGVRLETLWNRATARCVEAP